MGKPFIFYANPKHEPLGWMLEEYEKFSKRVDEIVEECSKGERSDISKFFDLLIEKK